MTWNGQGWKYNLDHIIPLEIHGDIKHMIDYGSLKIDPNLIQSHFSQLPKFECTNLAHIKTAKHMRGSKT
jgi:hypothetical protein